MSDLGISKLPRWLVDATGGYDGLIKRVIHTCTCLGITREDLRKCMGQVAPDTMPLFAALLKHGNDPRYLADVPVDFVCEDPLSFAVDFWLLFDDRAQGMCDRMNELYREHACPDAVSRAFRRHWKAMGTAFPRLMDMLQAAGVFDDE